MGILHYEHIFTRKIKTGIFYNMNISRSTCVGNLATSFSCDQFLILHQQKKNQELHCKFLDTFLFTPTTQYLYNLVQISASYGCENCELFTNSWGLSIVTSVM